MTITKENLKVLIAKNALLIRVSGDETQRAYHIYRWDGENVIVMFRDGKCSGIQRMMRDQFGVPTKR